MAESRPQKTERILPVDLDAERAVLGSLIIDNQCIPLVLGILCAADFSTLHNRAVFSAIERLDSDSDSGADCVTIMHALKGKHGVTASYLSDLMGSVPSAVMVETYAALVKKCSDQRNIITASRTAAEKAYAHADPVKIRAELQASLEAGVGGDSQMVTMKEALDEFRATYNDNMGFLTGLIDLDSYTGGMYEGVNLITGVPGAGKTTLYVQIFLRALKAKHRGMVFSIDQPMKDLSAIMASQSLGISVEGVARDPASTRKEEQFDCMWYKGDFSLDRISATFKNYAAQGYDWALIDYIGLIKVPGYQDWKASVEAVNEFKRLAHQYHVTVLAIQSITRVENEYEPGPWSSRGGMEMNHAPEQSWTLTYVKDSETDRMIHLGKSRKAQARKRVRLEYNGELHKFYDEGNGETAGREHGRLPEARREPEGVAPEQGLLGEGDSNDPDSGIASKLMPGIKPGSAIGTTPPDDDIPF